MSTPPTPEEPLFEIINSQVPNRGPVKLTYTQARESVTSQLRAQGHIKPDEEVPMDRIARLSICANPATLARYCTQAGWTEGEEGRFQAPPHICLLNERIVATIARPRGRLIVSMPRRHGKSRLGTIWTPFYYLAITGGKRRVIIDAHSDEYAEQFSRKIRRIIGDSADRSEKAWGPLVGLRLSRDSKAVGRWDCQGGGGIIAAGVGAGSGMGSGASLRVTDDPVGGPEDAYSERERAKIWEWWETSAETGLEPGAAMIVIQTRWHQEDLIGHILDSRRVKLTPPPHLRKAMHDSLQPGEWEYLRLPALSEGAHIDPMAREEGKALWPGRITEAEIRDHEGTAAWAGLYQQRPTNAEGDLLKREWFKEYDQTHLKREGGKVYFNHAGEWVAAEVVLQSWDTTFKSSKEADYVVGQVWARAGKMFYLLDQVRARMDFPTTVEAIKEMCDRWPEAKTKLIEESANGHAIIQTLQHKIPGIRPVSTQGRSKVVRVSMALPRLHAVADLIKWGQVWIPSWVSWKRAFLDECAAFGPAAAHDDVIDAMSQSLIVLQPGSWAHAKPSAPPPPKTLDEAWQRDWWKGLQAQIDKLRGGDKKLNPHYAMINGRFGRRG